jgi:hypothetical protein
MDVYEENLLQIWDIYDPSKDNHLIEEIKNRYPWLAHGATILE